MSESEKKWRASFALTLAPFGRQALAMRAEHEAAEWEARKLGIEAEAKARWRQRCEEAQSRMDVRPPTLRQCVSEILREQAA